MNRALKFRAWDRHKDKMKYQVKFKPKIPLTLDIIFSEITGLVWMQYTGFKDKNGREIYEGDIVHQKMPATGIEYTAEVVFNRGRFCLDMGTIPWDLVAEACEVIGNVFEDPELLEDKDGGK